MILDAIQRAGVRAIVQSGWAEVAVESDDVLEVGDMPHEWLFPRRAAVVHHAGAGTTAAGLRAGVPAVTVPVIADQPFWAERVHHLGAGPAPIPLADLSPHRLTAAIRAALNEPQHRASNRTGSASQQRRRRRSRRTTHRAAHHLTPGSVIPPVGRVPGMPERRCYSRVSWARWKS